MALFLQYRIVEGSDQLMSLRLPQTFTTCLSLVSWKILLLYCPQPDKDGVWQQQLGEISVTEPRITGL